MGRTTVTALVIALAALVTAAGCGDGEPGATGDGGVGAPRFPTTPPAIEGTLTSVTPSPSSADDCVPPDGDPDGAVSRDDPAVCVDPDGEAPLGRILVETEPGTDGGDKGVLSVGHDTVLRDPAGRRLGFSDLRAGQRVRAWHTGDVAESFPWQARAVAVEVVDDGG